MNVEYRMAFLEDVDQLADMRFEFTAEDASIDTSDEARLRFRSYFRSFAEEIFNGDRWVVWVAEVKKEIVAHIYIERIDKVPRPEKVYAPFYYMTNVYTKPAFRGKGIGSRLLKEIHLRLDAEDAEFIMVWPSENGRKFYEMNGYNPLNDPMAR